MFLKQSPELEFLGEIPDIPPRNQLSKLKLQELVD